MNGKNWFSCEEWRVKRKREVELYFYTTEKLKTFNDTRLVFEMVLKVGLYAYTVLHYILMIFDVKSSWKSSNLIYYFSILFIFFPNVIINHFSFRHVLFAFSLFICPNKSIVRFVGCRNFWFNFFVRNVFDPVANMLDRPVAVVEWGRFVVVLLFNKRSFR